MTHLITEPAYAGTESLAQYVARGGYSGLRRALNQGPEWLLSELEAAGLRGRGASGQGRPAAAKWRKVARAPGETRYVIGNGAESSPVSRKDRHVMQHFPHRVLEGTLAAALATGAQMAYLYVRGDAPEAIRAMEEAAAAARGAGLWGAGTALPIGLEVKTSFPSYISGEETAIIDALEGQEGTPQPKPPLPEQAGLFGCPTLVTNVETLAAAAAIVRLGTGRWRQAGTPECPGTALFTVSGDVQLPGVYEVAYGTTLRQLLDRAGAPDSDGLEAVLPGGLSSGPLRPDELGVPLIYEALAEIGSSLGMAAVVAFRKGGVGLPAMVRENAAFLADASCGQCNGCKEGTRALANALAAGDAGAATGWAELLFNGRGNCAHPAGAARFALRAITAFPDQFPV